MPPALKLRNERCALLATYFLLAASLHTTHHLFSSLQCMGFNMKRLVKVFSSLVHDTISTSAPFPYESDTFLHRMAMDQPKPGKQYSKGYQYPSESYLQHLTPNNAHALNLLTVSLPLPALLTSPCSLEEYKDDEKIIRREDNPSAC
uniref:Uncharacterized protein n=1 Tax=Romanomermis culicivorax TaxID=13658 RepID=A0A915IJ80_ROMCU